MPLQIVLDPDNWKTGYIVDDSNHVWRMTNAGADPSDFTDITGNLNSSLGISFAAGLGSLAIYPNTTAPNDEVVFVGGFGGIAATDAANLGASTTWTRFGTGIPNVAVSGLTYNPADNVLVAATFGRGFYEVKNLSNFVGHPAPVVKLGAPAAVGNDYATAFTSGGGAVAIADPNANITDPSSTSLSQATITVTNPFDGIGEFLTANTAGTSITASNYNPVSGQLILSGTDTLAHYKQVLATVKFNDTAAVISGNTRFISVVVTDGVASGRATTTLSVVGAANVPVVTGGGTTTAVLAGTTTSIHSAPVAISDPVSPTLASATETIVNLLDAPDETLAADTTGTGVTAAYDPETGVLTLSGTDTLANYQQVLDTVTYDNTAALPNLDAREIVLAVNDGTNESVADDVFLDIAPVNHAPVIDPSAAFTLDGIDQNATNPPGTFVSDLLNTATPGPAVTDADPNDPQGIAVVGVDDTNGTWQYSIDAGTTWASFADVSSTRAYLLAADVATLVRFVPNAGFSGTVSNGFTIRAWDQTSGLPQAAAAGPEIDGTTADTSTNGGSSPFSSTSATAAVTVTPVNQPPTFTKGPDESVNANDGPQTVAGWATPIVPGGAGNATANVTFQVSDDNHSFFQVQPAISSNGTLTFTPATMTSGGTATVTVVARNDGGTANGGVDTGAAQTFTITVVPADANHRFVQALYQDFLGRSGTPSELQGWVDKLSSLGQAGVADAVARSREADVQAVNRLYLQFLGRTASDVPSLDWVVMLQDGATLEAVAAGILGSAEFARRADTLVGGANADDNLIRAYYQVVLNRTASVGEVGGWLAELPAASHAQIAGGFLSSLEFRTIAVGTLYGDPTLPPVPFETDLLHRRARPAPAEVQGWVNPPLDLRSIGIRIASGEEYYNES